MKIDIKDGMDSKRGQWAYCTDNPYNPQNESFRGISVSNLMSLKNILENYKYHTLKEIENIIGGSQDVFEISNRSGALLEIEDGLNMIDNCLHPEGAEKAEESPFVIKESDIKPYTFTIKLNSENEEEDKKEEDDIEKEGDINKESLLNTLKDVIRALCNKTSDDDEDDYTWYLRKDLWEKANAHNARNTWTDPDKKKVVREIKWVKDRVKDDGVPKSISIEKKADGTYEVWLIRAENEPNAIKKLKICETLDDALDFVEKNYIGIIYKGE